MEALPSLLRLTHKEKDKLIHELWDEIQELKNKLSLAEDMEGQLGSWPMSDNPAVAARRPRSAASVIGKKCCTTSFSECAIF